MSRQQRGNLDTRLATWSTVVGAAVAVIAAVIGAVTFDRTQRAWIAPMAISILGTPQVGKPITISLKFENVGNEPAREVVLGSLTASLIPLRTGHGDIPYIEGVAWPRNTSCDVTVVGKSDATYFPSSTNRAYEHVAHAFTGGGPVRMAIDGAMREVTVDGVPQEVFDKKAAFFVHGCILYRTETIFSGLLPGELPLRRSAFCFYVLPLREGEFYQGVSLTCPVGNDAN